MNLNSLRIKLLILIGGIAVIIACAEVAAPPGGEEDKTRPSLVESWPPNGAVEVPRDNKITLRFSERIKAPGVGGGVFISPRPIEDPKIKWKSDRIEIILADSFLTDQTYVISISSDVRDLRNNPVDTGSTVAFSTGQVIDSGSVTGFIMDDSKTLAGTKVALFDPTRLSDSLDFDSVYPAYMVQSGVGGYFSFNYLPEREFFLIAFEDENRNDWFDKFEERFAIPDRPISIGSDLSLDSLYLPMNRYDTVGQAIVLARLGSNGMLLIRLREEVETAILNENLSYLTLESHLRPDELVQPVALLDVYQDRSRALNYYVPDAEPGLYRVNLYLPNELKPLVFDSLYSDSSADLTAPEISKYLPGDLPVLKEDASIALFFSEPLDSLLLTEGTFSLWRDSITEEPFVPTWNSPLELQLEAPAIEEGRSYTIFIAEFEIADMSGNRLGDTLKQMSFRFLDPDSLGSVSGRCHSALTDSTSQLLIRFEMYQNGSIHEQPVSKNDFELNLPAGHYRLTGFADRNNNGRRDAGSLDPFTYSESYAIYADTIKVRARFETTGIEFEIK